MKIHQLEPAVNSKKEGKRLGRGIGSGLGKTSGKGHKGQWARSGGGVRIGFEGGQKSLLRRLPKKGFDNAWKKVYSIINLDDLEVFATGEMVSAQTLLEKGVLSKVEPYGVKVLGNGEIKKKLTVKAKAFSKSAKEKLEKAGCTVILLDSTEALPKLQVKQELNKPSAKPVAAKPPAKPAAKPATTKTPAKPVAKAPKKS